MVKFQVRVWVCFAEEMLEAPEDSKVMDTAAINLGTDGPGWLSEETTAVQSFGLVVPLLTAEPWSRVADVC